MNELLIVMYHYVRPILGSKFPGIKGLELEGFRRQLDYLIKNYNIITTEQVIHALLNESNLPKKACWLTFDDGYKDHYSFVLPELVKRNLHGAFFPPCNVIEERMTLDVNLIHHILSCAENVIGLVSNLNARCQSYGINESKISSFYKKYAIPNRFDNADTVYVKRMLQHVLPEDLRSYIVRDLFDEFVGVNIIDFSKELYMSIDEVRSLIKNGMYVGSHGSMHYWLNKISSAEQERDIKKSLNFLEHIGSATKNWIMCYPYGAYNKDTLALLHKYNASMGITTDVRIANLRLDNPFKIPRLDTNDLPQ